MNRRGFLQALGLAATGLVLDPEHLLWVPGQKTIFLPPVIPVQHGNVFITEEWIGKEFSRVWMNNYRRQVHRFSAITRPSSDY